MLRYAKMTIRWAHNMHAGLIFGACISAYIFYMFSINDVFSSRMMSYILCGRRNTKDVKPFKRFKIYRIKKVVVLGLAGCGKTSLLRKISNAYGSIPSRRLTSTVYIYPVKRNNFLFNMWDLSKEDREYKKWSIFLIHADMIMYLIDSTKKDELGFNTALLKYTLKNSLLVNSQVLVVATKQDQPNVLKVEEIEQHLKSHIKSHEITVIGSCLNSETANLPEKEKANQEASAVIVLEELFKVAVRHHLFDNKNY